MLIRDMQCCGVKELHGLNQYSTPGDAMAAFVQNWKRITPHRPFAIFSGVVDEQPQYDYAKRFANYIKKQGLGTIHKTPVKLNSNSGNPLQVYVWAIAPNKLTAWAKGKRIGGLAGCL